MKPKSKKPSSKKEVEDRKPREGRKPQPDKMKAEISNEDTNQ